MKKSALKRYRLAGVRSERDMSTGAVTAQVHAIHAKSKLDNNRVAIHLLYPNGKELERAFEDAFAKGFGLIVLHTSRTWPCTLPKPVSGTKRLVLQ